MYGITNSIIIYDSTEKINYHIIELTIYFWIKVQKEINESSTVAIFFRTTSAPTEAENEHRWYRYYFATKPLPKNIVAFSTEAPASPPVERREVRTNTRLADVYRERKKNRKVRARIHAPVADDHGVKASFNEEHVREGLSIHWTVTSPPFTY